MRKRISLNTLFRELNQDLFCGRLPKYRVVLADLGTAHGRCLPERRLIRLDKQVAEDFDKLRRTLIHEMCHHGCPHHGKRFLAKLARLSEMGEEWAAEEADEYRNSPSWNDEMREVKVLIEEFARRAKRDKRCSFDLARRQVCRRLEMTPREVDRKIPWLKSTWRNATRGTSEMRQSR